MKIDKYRSFQPALWPSSAEEEDLGSNPGPGENFSLQLSLPLQLMKATVLAESTIFIAICLTPAMSTDRCQVGVALFPSC